MNNPRKDAVRILIAGGGTGGHIFAALAIKQAIVRKNPLAQIIFAGTKKGLEYKILKYENEKLKTLWISGISRSSHLKNLLLPLKLAVSFFQSFWILLQFKPNLIIGTGGYAMGPVLWVGQRLGIKTLLQEQNSFPGITTRKLSQEANAICLGFESAKEKLNPNNLFYTGNPLRSSFQQSQKKNALSVWNFAEEKKTILIMGGSLGAQSINYAVAEALPELLSEYNIIWQTGKTGIPKIADAKLILNSSKDPQKCLVVSPFIDNVPDAYAVADLAICRAGALTLAELAIVGLPAILIPYPHAADDHQTANALSLANGGAAYLIKDRELNGNVLSDLVKTFFNDSALQSKMRHCMQSFAKPNAASDIAEIGFDIIEGK